MVDNNYRALAQALPYVEQDRARAEDEITLLKKKLALLESIALYSWIGSRLNLDVIEITLNARDEEYDTYYGIHVTCDKTIGDNVITYPNPNHAMTPDITVNLKGEYAFVEGIDMATHNHQQCIISRACADKLIIFIDGMREQYGHV